VEVVRGGGGVRAAGSRGTASTVSAKRVGMEGGQTTGTRGRRSYMQPQQKTFLIESAVHHEEAATDHSQTRGGAPWGHAHAVRAIPWQTIDLLLWNEELTI
jgi:hypothetical protein